MRAAVAAAVHRPNRAVARLHRDEPALAALVDAAGEIAAVVVIDGVHCGALRSLVDGRIDAIAASRLTSLVDAVAGELFLDRLANKELPRRAIPTARAL